MKRLVNMLEKANPSIKIKVERFISSDGISGLGEQPFVRTNILSMML